MGQFGRVQLARGAVLQLRSQLVEHGQILAGFKTFCADDDIAGHLVQSVLQFVQAVGRVDAHHDGADFGAGKLGQAPLHPVGGPDTNAVTRFYAQVQQAGGQPVDFMQVFGIGPANPLVANHQCFVIRVPGGDPVQALADGFAQQRLVGGPF